MSIITVKGKGEMSLEADLIQITFDISTTDKVYEKAMEESNEKLEALRNALTACSFEKNDLKTASYNVFREYSGEYDDKGRYKQVFNGYTCSHSLELSFGLDLEKLNRVLSALAQVADVSFNVSFRIKDTDAADNELIRLAYEDAREKAGVLAKAAGKTVKDVREIIYTDDMVSFVSETMYREESANLRMAKFAGTDMAPKEITSQRNVKVIFETE